jgi:hypothetical protein
VKAFDSIDPSGNTILVAVGTRSAFSNVDLPLDVNLGGPAIGLLYTQNALDPQPTWKVLDNQSGNINFRNNKVKFRSAFVRGSLMLAVANQAEPFSCSSIGVFRSIDSGVTWTNVLLGSGRELAADPNNPNRFYATLDNTKTCNDIGFPNNGVFTSADMGERWTFTSLVPGTTQMEEGKLNNAKLSVSRNNSRVWSALLKDGVVDSISYSDNQGSLWLKMDDVKTQDLDGSIDGLNPRVKPGSQGGIHFSLLASPTNPNEVYVGGDRQDAPFKDFFNTSNFIGALDYTGRLFRGDASVTATNTIPSPQWEHLTDVQNQGIPGGGTASSSAPHADSRDMEIRVDGSLLESDDGGITVRTSPEDNTGDWFSVCGNMQVFETHSIAYEPLSGMVLFGNQDTGTILGKLGTEDTFNSVQTGDGTKTMIDYKSDPDFSFFYFGAQKFGFYVRVAISKNTNEQGEPVDIPLPSGLEGDFVTVAAMNPADQTVFAVAVRITPAPNTAPGPINQIAFTVDKGDNYTTVTSAPISGNITSMVWSDDGNVFVASGDNFAACAFTLSTGLLNCTVVGNVGASVRRLAVNPDKSNEVYAATTNPDLSSPGVFVSTNGGSTWADITIPGSPVDTARIGGSVAYIKKGTTSAVVVGTSNGVHFFDSTTMTWKLLATDLPKVPIMEMLYEETDDRLVLGTLGRGVWYLDRASDVASFVLTGVIPPRKHGAQYNDMTIDFSSISVRRKVPP